MGVNAETLNHDEKLKMASNSDIEESRTLLDGNVIMDQVVVPTVEESSRKFQTKVAVAVIAALALVGLAVANRPETTSPIPSVVDLKAIDPIVDFSIGKMQTTETTPDGVTEALVGNALKIDCNKKALIGFNMNTKKVDGVDNIFYEYYCDDSGADMDSATKMVTKNKIDAGSHVGSLSTFHVDCGSNIGLNYVLTSLKLAKAESDESKYNYEYECATYEGGMLTCAQFYTDLAPESDVDSSVSSLADHPVQCFEGSALQEFRYERRNDEVRYSYQCCTKANVPTPSPTPLPTFEPTLEPTVEPSPSSSSSPVTETTEAPVVLMSLKPTAADTDSPTFEPVANPTEMPTDEPIAEKTDKPIQQPTSAPSEEKPLDPIIVEAEQLPRYCPFTYLAGTSKLEVFDGCSFFSQDQLIYMRDEETSPSVYICTSKEDGDVEITNKDLRRYGLIDVSEMGTVSDVRVGKNTKVDVLNKQKKVLFTVTPDDMRLVKERQINEADIHSALLTTTVSAIDVKIPADCDTQVEDNAEAAIEGNKPVLADGN